MRLSRVAAALVMSVLVGACTRGAPAEQPAGPKVFDLGSSVSLTAPVGAFGKGVTVSGHAPSASLPDIAGFPVVAAVEVVASEQPKVPVAIDLPVEAAAYMDLPSNLDDKVLVLHRHEGQDWEPLLGRLDRGRGTVTVTTDRLSLFGVLLPSLGPLRDEVGAMLNGALGGVDFRPAVPKCTDEKAARDAGWTVSSSTLPVLQWCLGLTGGKPELKIVASRRYPLLATVGAGLTARGTTGGELPVALAQAMTSALTDGRQATLSPGGTTTLGVSLKDGQRTQLTTEFDGFAQSLVSLQVAADLLIAIAQRMPSSKPTAKSGAEALAALDAADCVPKLLDLANDLSDPGRVGAMVSACLKPEDVFAGMARVVVDALVGVVALVGGVIAYMWGSVSALVDEITGQSRYVLSVAKQVPTPVIAPPAAAPVTLAGLLSAPVPALRGNSAGRLVNGELPGVPGTVALERSEPPPAFGDLTGDRVTDAAAVIDATSGAGGNDQYVAVYSNGKLLGTIDPAALSSGFHAYVDGLVVTGGQVRITWSSESADLSDNTSWRVSLRWSGGALVQSDLAVAD